MAITDELREYIDSHLYVGARCLGGWKEVALLIADRIDAEHERMYADLTVDMGPMTDESMAEHGWIRLPLDADGVPIHVGDRLDGYGKTIEVVELRHGRSGWVLISRDGNAYADNFAFTHYHAPTVEDVLREFAECVRGQNEDFTALLVSEYAAKLRLGR